MEGLSVRVRVDVFGDRDDQLDELFGGDARRAGHTADARSGLRLVFCRLRPELDHDGADTHGEVHGRIGRPSTTGRGEGVLVRLHPPQLAALDTWIARQPDPRPSRPDAIRRLVERPLATGGGP